jgi:starvation-inducible DNA-binding protein
MVTIDSTDRTFSMKGQHRLGLESQPSSNQRGDSIMFKTKNDLSEEVRIKAVKLLNERLADCIDLQTQTKQAHWNVKGPNFIALHELFDQINAAVEDYVDEIAERAVQLGGVAEGTARMVARRSSLAEYPAAVVGHSHVEALSSALAAFGKSTRKAIDDANEISDLDTADLFTEVSRGIDKWLWFVEAHLQGPR